MTAKGARCVAVLQTKVLRYRLFQMMCSTICPNSKFEGVVWRGCSPSIFDPQGAEVNGAPAGLPHPSALRAATFPIGEGSEPEAQ